MKNIMVINLGSDSQQIADSLQKFYGDKAKVGVMEITDKPKNIDIIFFEGISVMNNQHNGELLKEITRVNSRCKTIAYFEKGGEQALYEARLRARFGGDREKLYCDEDIYKGYLLDLSWYGKDRLFNFLIPKQTQEYSYTSIPRDEWVEY